MEENIKKVDEQSAKSIVEAQVIKKILGEIEYQKRAYQNRWGKYVEGDKTVWYTLAGHKTALDNLKYWVTTNFSL